MKRSLVLAAAAAATLFTATAANAGSNVHWSVGVNLPPVATVVSNGPAYYPAPVYGAPVDGTYYPEPVYYSAPAYSYYPAPVYGALICISISSPGATSVCFSAACSSAFFSTSRDRLPFCRRERSMPWSFSASSEIFESSVGFELLVAVT